MPSSWGVYYVVFLSAFLSLGIPVVLSLISKLIAPKGEVHHETSSPPLNTMTVGRRMNSRFFLAANSATLLICLALILVPSIGTLRGETAPAGLVAVLSICVLCATALAYAVGKGDMDWLRDLSDRNAEKREREK